MSDFIKKPSMARSSHTEVKLKGYRTKRFDMEYKLFSFSLTWSLPLTYFVLNIILPDAGECHQYFFWSAITTDNYLYRLSFELQPAKRKCWTIVSPLMHMFLHRQYHIICWYFILLRLYEGECNCVIWIRTQWNSEVVEVHCFLLSFRMITTEVHRCMVNYCHGLNGRLYLIVIYPTSTGWLTSSHLTGIDST